MKNLTLLAAMAVCGVGIANAQYVGDPALSKTTSTGNLYDVILLARLFKTFVRTT